MLSTNFLIGALEYLQQKFHDVADQHLESAKVHDEVIAQRTAIATGLRQEAQLARNFANKIGSFLENE